MDLQEKLKLRNKKQVYPFAELIRCYQNVLFENVNLVKERSRKTDQGLSLENEKLINAVELNDKVSKLEEKIAVLKDQLHQSQHENVRFMEEMERLKICIAEERKDKALFEEELVRVRDRFNRLEKKHSIEKEQLIEKCIKDKQNMMEEMNNLSQLMEKHQVVDESVDMKNNKKAATKVVEKQVQRGGNDLTKLSVRHGIQAHATEVNAVLFSKASVVTASADSMIRIWDFGSAKNKADFRNAGGHAFIGLDVHAHQDLILGTSSDRTCRVWNQSTGRILHTLTGHGSKVMCGKFLQSEKQLLTGSGDRCIKIWDLYRGYCLNTLNCRSTCHDITTSIGSTFISGHQDGSAKVWDLRSSSMIHEIPQVHENQSTTCVAYNSNETQLLTSGKDHQIKLLDTRNWNVIHTFKHPEYRASSTFSKVCFSPNDLHILAGSASGTVFIWDTSHNALTAKLQGKHQSPIICCAWNEEGTHIASADKHGLLNIWTT